MSRHYSIKHFFRQIPNALLSRYFRERGLFTDLDFAAMKEMKIDDLFKAWLELPDDQRKGMDAEFYDIFEMSCEKGFVAILDEARWQMRNKAGELAALVDALSTLPGPYDRAMVTYLDHRGFWKGATHFYHADSLSYWRKRKHMGQNPAAVDDTSIRELADSIKTYFHTIQGRGKNCVVECFRRGDRDYFFAYPEDFSQQNIEWVNGEFDRRPHTPAFEVVYVYSRAEGSLDLNYRGARNAVEPLQAMFSEAILKQEKLPPDPKDERVYDLNPLGKKEFEFVYEAGSGITKVAVKKLRLTSKMTRGDRITLEADTAKNPYAIYDLLATMRKSVPLDLYFVTQVELAASIVTNPDKPAKSVTVRIGYPNSCSLKYDKRDLKLRDMLEASGIETKEPVEASDA